MNFVPTHRQFNTQLSGDNSAATVGRIAGDSDLHSPVLSAQPVRLSDSMVTGAMGFRFWNLRKDEENRD
jgi:hypothetical protein